MALSSSLLSFLFLAIVACFMVYTALELRIMLLTFARQQSLRKQATVAAPVDASFLPTVAVLLPMCNEPALGARLINAACAFDYPAGQWEILVLDDSQGGETPEIMTLVAEHAARGIAIRYLHRGTNQGAKAGNLRYGAQHTTADFLALFDEDFLPPPDFLRRTLPYFAESSIGYLQTAIGYSNQNASFLTKMLATSMGHQQAVTTGLSAEGNMASLSGSSCVWRRQCLEQLGGWRADTATEDVDLGYRAQLHHWQYAYVETVTSLSVLPESMQVFRVQHERWGRGLMHNAFKHARTLLHTKMPLLKRLYALSMMFSSVLLAAIYVLFLLTLPIALSTPVRQGPFLWGILLFYATAGIWGVSNLVGSSLFPPLRGPKQVAQLVCNTYRYISLFLPRALYYFIGGIRACQGVTEFNRTPKSQTATTPPKGTTTTGKQAPPAINGVLIKAECASFLYSCIATAATLYTGNLAMLPLAFTGCLGFGSVLLWEWKEHRSHIKK